MAPKKKKRKYSSSVAAAARDALYSSSSDSSSEEEESESDDESESSSSSEEDEPIRKKKKVSASSKSNTTSSKHTSTKAKYSRRHLKPLFEKGDKVSSAWWQDEKRSGETQWYPGSIKSYTQEETNSPYGPTRYYDIDFDDGDELTDVEDYYVFPEVDYILQQKNDFKPNWIGVKNVTDKSVKGDRWPGDVGWYVATLGDGKESEHARLSGKWVYSFAVVLIYCAVCIANTNNEHILCTKLYTQMQWMPMTIILYKPRGRKQRNRN